MRQVSKRWLPVVLAVAILLLGSAYLLRDDLIGRFVQSALTNQAQVAFGQEVTLTSLMLDSGRGYTNIGALALASLDDPQQQQNFAAERVEFDVQVSGIFSPHVLVRHARVHNAEVLLEYIAPGVSNLKMLEQNYKTFAQQRKIEGKSRLLEWDLEHIEFYNVRFRLIDYDGQQLADVIIPRVALDSLSTSQTPEENLAALLRQIQFGVLEETIKGRVEGDYDLPGLLSLVRRELPNSRLLSKEPMKLMKKAGKSLLEKWLQ